VRKFLPVKLKRQVLQGATAMTKLFKSLEWKYAAIAVLPLVLLLFQPAVNYTVLAFGEPVLLKTRPVDPRDILRGDYVVLDYDISHISEDLLPEDFKNDEYNYEGPQRVFFVTLKRASDGVGSIESVSASRPSDKLYLKVRINHRWTSYYADYGLEAYFVPEGAGGELEDRIRDNAVYADVRVLWGRGVINSLQFREKEKAPVEGNNDTDE
jgi:uncharacterized membrane-anchored protein